MEQFSSVKEKKIITLILTADKGLLSSKILTIPKDLLATGIK